MRILLTGGNGLIGHHLGSALDRAGIEFVKLVRNPLRAPTDAGEPFLGDLANAADVDRFVDLGDTLIHLAWTSNPRSSDRDINSDILQNLAVTARLFESFSKQHPHGHIIFASTGGDIYSFDPPYRPRAEDDKPEPNSSYSIQKLAAEHYLKRFARKHGTSSTVLRIGNVYGTFIPAERALGLIGVALSLLQKDRPIALLEPLNSVRDYVHLDDVAAAFTTVARNRPGQAEHRVFNVGSGIGHSIGDVFDAIHRVTGKAIQWHDAYPENQAPTWNVLEVARIRALTAWSPTIPLDQGIAAIWSKLG